MTSEQERALHEELAALIVRHREIAEREGHRRGRKSAFEEAAKLCEKRGDKGMAKLLREHAGA